MALPSSGPISFGDINVEASRTRNTANTQLSGGSTPTAGSLVKLYESSGVDQNAPHTISEFYGKSYILTVRLYGKKNNSVGTIQLKYGINDTEMPNSAGFLTTGGGLMATFTVNSGDIVYISNLDGATSYQQCSQIGTDTYCSVYECNVYDSFTITSNTDISTQINTSTTC